MTFQETVTKVTSFAALLLSAGRIRQLVDDTGRQYIGAKVIETTPRGNKWEATIGEIVWDQSVGLHGDWIIYIRYTANVGLIGSWVGREVLTLKDGS